MLVKIEARILVFPGTDFHFPSTSVRQGTFLGSDRRSIGLCPATTVALVSDGKHLPREILRVVAMSRRPQ